MSDALPYMVIPYVWYMWFLVFSLGAHATISPLLKTFLAMRPEMSASAILPAPMKPILADMPRTIAGLLEIPSPSGGRSVQSDGSAARPPLLSYYNIQGDQGRN